MVHLDLWKGLLKQGGHEISFELGQSGEIPQTGRQRIPDKRSDETERALTNRILQIYFPLSTYSAILPKTKPLFNSLITLQLSHNYCTREKCILLRARTMSKQRKRTRVIYKNSVSCHKPPKLHQEYHTLMTAKAPK